MEALANTEYQDVYRIVDGVLLIVNKFLYKDYSKKTKRIVRVNDIRRAIVKHIIKAVSLI